MADVTTEVSAGLLHARQELVDGFGFEFHTDETLSPPDRDRLIVLEAIEFITKQVLIEGEQPTDGFEPTSVIGQHALRLAHNFDTLARWSDISAEDFPCDDAEPQFVRSLTEVERGETSDTGRDFMFLVEEGVPIAIGKHRGDDDRWLTIANSTTTELPAGLIVEYTNGALEECAQPATIEGVCVVDIEAMPLPKVMRTTLFAFGAEERGNMFLDVTAPEAQPHIASTLTMTIDSYAQRSRQLFNNLVEQ